MAQERRFIGPYTRDGQVVRGHEKNVRTSDVEQRRAQRNAAEGVKGFVEDASDVDAGRNGGRGFGWSTMEWGATATGLGGVEYVTTPRTAVPATWDQHTGQGYVTTADGQTLWLGPEVKLSGVRLEGVAIPNANLTGASLVDVELDGVDLTGANLTGATLDHVHAVATNLTDVNLTHAMVNRSRFESVTLTGSNLTGAGVGSTQFTDCDLRGVTGDGAQMVRVQLESVSAEQSSWKEAGFSDVGMRISHFDNAIWDGADIEKLRVTASSLYGVRASGATFNRFIAYSTDLRKMDFVAATATGFDVNRSCRYEAIPPGYAPLHLLESGRLEGRANADNEKLPQVFDWENRNDYHIPLWSYQMNGLY
jgi:uncharacterized protein YjbI with pentapeptide repeats